MWLESTIRSRLQASSSLLIRFLHHPEVAREIDSIIPHLLVLHSSHPRIMHAVRVQVGEEHFFVVRKRQRDEVVGRLSGGHAQSHVFLEHVWQSAVPVSLFSWRTANILVALFIIFDLHLIVKAKT